MTRTLAGILLAVTGVIAAASVARGQALTADQAVEIALKNSVEIANANAGVQDASGSMLGAYSGVLPRASGSLSRSGAWSRSRSGDQVFGGLVFPSDRTDVDQFSTSPSLSGSWSALDLSALSSLNSARNGLKAARLRRSATRSDIAFNTRRQFYEVVRAIKLAEVADGAATVARDDERRVRALFEVGSVSRSDLLKAQVRSSQSQLDSLTSHHNVSLQRISLARLIGLTESEMGAVDTSLTVSPRDFDEAALLEEASSRRPDLLAAQAELRSAQWGLRSAHFQRLPSVVVTGGMTYRPRSSFTVKTLDTSGVTLADPIVQSGRNRSDLTYQASVALEWNLFDGLATDSRIASARARHTRARSSYDALRRNLASDVHEAVLSYQEALERRQVAERAVASAAENLNLTQQKYNVGSATILELVDAQVQLERANSDWVSALAAIRVAEAQIDRVRGVAK